LIFIVLLVIVMVINRFCFIMIYFSKYLTVLAIKFYPIDNNYKIRLNIFLVVIIMMTILKS
jgi:hypothetical protein